MDLYETPRGLAAVYHMGELQAQLTAEREKLKRAEQTNAFLIELISQQHPIPNKLNTEIESLRQRIKELNLELRLKHSQLEQAQKQVEHDHAREAHASRPGTLLGGTVYASPVQMESTSCFEKQHDGVKDVQSGGVNSQDQVTALAEASNDLNEKHPASDIPEAEWMQPVEEKAGTKTDGARAKPKLKRYFDPAAAAQDNVVVGAGSMVAAKKGPVQPSTQPVESNMYHPQPKHPVAVENLNTEPERYGRFERNHPRGPRSLPRPPPKDSPWYCPSGPSQYQPQYDPQYYPHDQPYHSSHFRPRPPPIDVRLTSYRDVDAPASVPQFGEQVIPSSIHCLPSAGYLNFTEDLYDEQTTSTDKRKKSKTNSSTATNTDLAPKGHPPNAPNRPPRIPAGLNKSVHAQRRQQTHWPLFTPALHNRRRVDLTNIPDRTPLAALMQQIAPSAAASPLILSVTPPRRVPRVVSAFETTVELYVTLEFARGDAAAAFIAHTGAAPIRIAGAVVKAVQCSEASPPIARSVGEQVWCRGASRRIVVEEAGAALRVPANLRYQIESCPYQPPVRRGGGDARGLLVGPPEFLEDGAIRVMFLDVRDAVVAFGTWKKSPIFRNVGVSYEREGVLPELAEENENQEVLVEERIAGKSREHSVKDGVSHSSDEEDEKTGQGGKVIDATEASGLDSSRCLRIARVPPVSELEKEGDKGYTAGSSEEIETSQTRSVPSAHGGSNKPPTESHEIEDKPGNDDEKREGVSPDHKPACRIGLYLSSGTHDAESDTTEEGEIREIIDNDSDSDRDAPPCRSSAAKHAFLNYDGCSDNPAHEPPASRQCGPYVPQNTTTTSFPGKQDKQDRTNSPELAHNCQLSRTPEQVEHLAAPFARELKRYDDLNESADAKSTEVKSTRSCWR